MGMKFDAERVRRNAAAATTEDLLDRATVYRADMEPAALAIIEAELARRDVSAEQIAAHGEKRRETSLMEGASARRCSFCFKPAVAAGWGWHRLFRRVPLFPRMFYY